MLNRYVYEDHALSAATQTFFNDLTSRVLNVVSERGLDPKDCNFVGSNDMLLFRGSNAALIVFSRSSHAHMPTVGEYDISEGGTGLEQIDGTASVDVPHRRSFSEQEIRYLQEEFQFFDPVGILFPASHITSLDRQKTIEAITELLMEPTMEDIDRKNRIVRANPIFQGRNFLLDSDLVFVLMDFGKEYTEIYDTLLKPTIEEEGFRCVRSDDIFRTTAVIEDIWENINTASLVVAEISNNNPNVMYELGICHTIGKEVMMITQDAVNIPFNFRHLRVYPYENNIAGSTGLKTNIKRLV